MLRLLFSCGPPKVPETLYVCCNKKEREKKKTHLFNWKYLGVSRKICILADNFCTEFGPMGFKVSEIVNPGKKNL